ncbi:MAG: hypothetical protein LBV32_04100 [Tannerellaceae bacterium]|jgi:hypothetical protein|nr:hypothetical protein [Tannerellaceae bacterium]
MKNQTYRLLTVAATALVATTFASCDNTEPLPSPDENTTIGNPDVVMLNNVDAQRAFSKILSKAVSESRDVRRFIKTEALAQFDNDYDVFYPFVKDKVVADGKTFRDILLSYCDSEDELIQIEESSLLLNILVPDFTLFWDFDAEKWNIDGDEIAVISRDDDTSTLYEAGEDIGTLSSGEIPGFPCLVVKNNERMVVSNSATRAGNTTYEFAHDAYNPAKSQIQTRNGDFYVNVEATDMSGPYAKASELDPIVINAYNELNGVAGAYQRDYIYYGIGKSNKPGILNRNVFEEIFKFRINKDALIIDDTNDPDLQQTTQKKGYLTSAEIIKRVWTEGKFEIVIKSYVSIENSSSPMERSLIFSLKPQDLFSIERAHVHHVNSTWFRHSVNTYTVTISDLQPKWVYPTRISGFNQPARVFLNQWDLYNTSMVMHMLVEEKDATTKKEITRNFTDQYANKLDFSMEGSGKAGGVNLAGKLGYGFSNTKSSTTSIKIQWDENSDELGTLSLYFTHPVIVSDSEKSTKGYKLHVISSGSFEMILVPRRL